MGKAFSAMKSGGAWSYAALVHGGLDDVLDEEGRPLSERRATSATKEGVPMVLKACPYSDARHSKPMNISALTQIARHLDGVVEEMGAFQASLPSVAPSWSRVLTVLVDQLGAPALHLLRTPSTSVVPAHHAVAHKLAAGYFGVLRSILAGPPPWPPVSTSGLLALVHRTDALLGASEVCAGPPPMLLQVTEALLGETPRRRAPLQDAPRAMVAEIFRRQIQIGICWEHFDMAFECRLFRELRDEDARTTFFARRLSERRSFLEQTPPPDGALSLALLPDDLSPDLTRQLKAAFQPQETREIDESMLGGEDVGAMRFASPEARRKIRQLLGEYLAVYTQVVGVLATLEQQLRGVLGLTAEALMLLHSTIFPRPVSLPWFEGVLGFRLSCIPTPEPRWTISNLPRPVQLPSR